MNQSERRLFLIQSLLKEKTEYRDIDIPAEAESQRQLLRGLMNIRAPQNADEDFLRVREEAAASSIADRRKSFCVWNFVFRGAMPSEIIFLLSLSMLRCPLRRAWYSRSVTFFSAGVSRST